MRNKIINLFRHTLLRGSIVVFIGSMVANFSGWLYHLIVGRILGPDKYAELSALFALFYILNVLTGAIQVILVKLFSTYKARQEYGQGKHLLLSSTKWIIIGSIFGLVLLVPFTSAFGAFLRIQSSFDFILLYLTFVISTLAIINGSVLQGFQLFELSSIYANIGMVIRLIFGTLFSFFGVQFALIGNMVSSLVSYVLSFIPVKFLFTYEEKPLHITKKQTLGYSVPIFLTTLGVTVLFSQDILLVKHFFTSHEAGIYSSLSILGKIIYYASSAVTFVLFPLVSERTELNKGFKKIVFLGLLVVGGISAVVTLGYFVAPGIAILPFGNAFIEASPYLGIFGIFISFFSLSSLLMYVLMAIGRSYTWIFTSFASIIQIILISIYHQSLYQIVCINIAVAIVLFASLFFYYLTYAKKSGT